MRIRSSRLVLRSLRRNLQAGPRRKGSVLAGRLIALKACNSRGGIKLIWMKLHQIIRQPFLPRPEYIQANLLELAIL